MCEFPEVVENVKTPIGLVYSSTNWHVNRNKVYRVPHWCWFCCSIHKM